MAPGERVGLRAFTASWSFALLSFARASGMAGASDRAAGCSWGAPWGRGARVEVWRVLGVGGVVPMAAGGMDLCAITASCSFALPSFATASGGARASDRAAGCSWGVPWGRGARVEVRRLWGVGGVVPMAPGAWVVVPSAHHVLLLCCLLQGPQVWQGLWIGLLVALGERHGAEVRVLRCGGCWALGAWCQWPRGAWIFVPSPHHVLLLCCLLPGLQKRKGLRIGLLAALGECHGAEVRVLR